MNTKMTVKDKRRLSFVGAVGIFFLFAFLVLLPLRTANQELKQQMEENEVSAAERERKVVQLPAMQKAYEERQTELAGILEPVYPMLKSQDIDRILQNEVLANSLFVTRLQITMPKEPSDVVAYGQVAKEQGSNPDKSEGGFYLVNVTLEVSGQMSDMFRLIDTFTDNMPGVRITSLYWSNDRKSGNTVDRTEDYDILEMHLQVVMSKHKGTVQQDCEGNLNGLVRRPYG